MPRTQENLPPLEQIVTVTRSQGTDVELSVSVRFNPDRIGAERTKRVWEGVAAILDALMTRAEIRKFLAKLNREKRKLAAKGGA
jgi:hypothetical protein